MKKIKTLLQNLPPILKDEAVIVDSRQAALGGGLGKAWGYYEHPSNLSANWA